MGRQAVKITADTNVLLRAAVGDHVSQGAIAEAELKSAEVVAVATASLCELVWVLRSRYGLSKLDIANLIRELIGSRNIVVDQPVVEAGLFALDAGGDFADGVIAYEGRRLGGEIFVSFDKNAVGLLKAAGASARQL